MQYKLCTFFLLIASSIAPPVHAASTWSKRQVDLISLKTPDSTSGGHMDSSHEPEKSQVSVVASSQSESNDTESRKSDQEVNSENLEHEWWRVLVVSAKRLGKAFEMYDQANATWRGDLRALAEDVKFFKLAFDTEYFLYQRRMTELQLNYIS